MESWELLIKLDTDTELNITVGEVPKFFPIIVTRLLPSVDGLGYSPDISGES